MKAFTEEDFEEMVKRDSRMLLARMFKERGYESCPNCPVETMGCVLWDGGCPFTWKPPEGPEYSTPFTTPLDMSKPTNEVSILEWWRRRMAEIKGAAGDSTC